MNSTIEYNWANSGGGIYNLGGTVIIANSDVVNNLANSGGGGFFNTNSIDGDGNLSIGELTLSNVNVLENWAGSSGGGLYNLGGIATVKRNSMVSENTASTNGGGIANVTIVEANHLPIIGDLGYWTAQYQKTSRVLPLPLPIKMVAMAVEFTTPAS